MLFCPRCAMQQTETTRFCRACGLPMTEVVQYVLSRGTAGLPPVKSEGAPSAPAGPTPVVDLFEAVYLKSSTKPSFLAGPIRLLHSAWDALSPRQKMALSILVAALSTPILGVLGAPDELTGLSALLTPLVILFVVFYFRNQARQPASPVQADPQRGEPLRPPMTSLPVSPPNELRLPERPRGQTHPFAGPVPSVVEDETRRL